MRLNNNQIGNVVMIIIIAPLVILKLIGAVKWSWWWVLSPIWIMVVLSILAILLIAIVSIKSSR